MGERTWRTVATGWRFLMQSQLILKMESMPGKCSEIQVPSGKAPRHPYK